MGTNHPLISIIVLNWNGGNHLKDCIKSIVKSNYNNLEIIISDNKSIDGSDCFVINQYPFIKLVKNEYNLGFSKGNNVAVPETKGEIVIFSNNDITVHPDTVTKISEVFVNPRVGVATGTICDPNSFVIQNAGLWVDLSGNILPNLAFETASQFENKKNKVIDVHAVQGAFLAVRKSVLEQIGLFDENLWAFYEDIDLCQRAKKAGYRVVIILDAFIWHDRSSSWKKTFNLQMKKSMLKEKGRIYFTLKHFGLTGFAKSIWHDFCFWTNQSTRFLLGCTETQKRTRVAESFQSVCPQEIRLGQLIPLTFFAKLMALISLPQIFKTARVKKSSAFPNTSSEKEN
jgi:hypothetical protein